MYQRLHWEAPLRLGTKVSGTSTTTTSSVNKVTDDAKRLAMEVLLHPFEFLGHHYAQLNMKGGTANRAKKALLDAKWVTEHVVAKRGGKPVLLEPLPSLAQAFNQRTPSWGKGGFLHAYMAHAIVGHLQKNSYTQIEKEKFYGSKAVDLKAVAPTGELIGIEVTVSFSNLVDNVQQDFLAQPNFNAIWVVCMDQAKVRQAKRTLSQAPALKSHMKQIQVFPITHYI